MRLMGAAHGGRRFGSLQACLTHRTGIAQRSRMPARITYRRKTMKTTFTRAGRILAILTLSGCASLSIVKADSANTLWDYSLHSVQRCQGAMNDSIESTAECFLGDGVNSLFDRSIGLAETKGEETFGDNFSITGRMAWSPDVGSTGGLDMVTPFSFGPGDDLAGIRSASFMQQGITRWRDEFGAMRNDLRHGVVHRFRVSEEPDSDVLGLSSFYLHSAEHGHEVLALGMDWFGRWGTGELRYFFPTTGWTMVRPGHEERPLEGVEMGTRWNLTTTIDMSVTGYQWEADDGSGDRDRGTRMGISWRPHPYLTFNTTWDDGNDEESMAAGLHLSIPLGPRTKRPRWEWFGVGGGHSSQADLYQAVPEIGQIRVASRSAPVSSSSGDQEVNARFVEPSVNSGESVHVELFVAEPAQRDITVTVRLEPGTTAPSAIPGEDYVDQAMEATITKGTTSAVVSFPLIRNDGMQEPRSLGVAVSVSSYRPS